MCSPEPSKSTGPSQAPFPASSLKRSVRIGCLIPRLKARPTGSKDPSSLWIRRRSARVRSHSEIARPPVGGIQLTGLLQISGSPGTRRSRAVQARRVTAASGRHGLDLLGPGVDDEVAVADGRVPDGQLEDAVEHHAAAA